MFVDYVASKNQIIINFKMNQMSHVFRSNQEFQNDLPQHSVPFPQSRLRD
jgi:hypothetical protein